MWGDGAGFPVHPETLRGLRTFCVSTSNLLGTSYKCEWTINGPTTQEENAGIYACLICGYCICVQF